MLNIAKNYSIVNINFVDVHKSSQNKINQEKEQGWNSCAGKEAPRDVSSAALPF